MKNSTQLTILFYLPVNTNVHLTAINVDEKDLMLIKNQQLDDFEQ